MQIRKVLLGVLFTAAAAAAHAGGSATITCGNAQPGYYNNGGVPTLNISYTPGTDAGMPGLFWLGVLSPDQTLGAVMTLDQGWTTYQGGLYPPQARYDNGLPGTITLSIPFPPDSQGATPMTTASYVGYSVYAGHGAYTQTAQQTVASRRAMLDAVKPQRVAAGTWKSDYDDDTRFIWSLIQKDMVDKAKYGPLLTVPFIDCTPPGN